MLNLVVSLFLAYEVFVHDVSAGTKPIPPTCSYFLETELGWFRYSFWYLLDPIEPFLFHFVDIPLNSGPHDHVGRVPMPMISLDQCLARI